MDDQTKTTKEFVANCTCGKAVYLQRDAEGSPDAVLHEEPTCEPYRSKEPEDFIHWLYTQRVPSA